MEETHLILLAEGNETVVVNALCDALGIEHEDKPYIVMKEKDFEISFYVVAKDRSSSNAEFFERQLDLIYAYFEEVETENNELKDAVLQQLSFSSSFVIINCISENEESSITLLIFDVVLRLLHLFCGLYLTDSGAELYDEHLNLVFSDTAQSMVTHFEPCESKPV